MPDIVRFKSGSKDSLLGANGAAALPISAGTVYFAVDANDKGYLYFDKDSTHRIWMGMSEQAEKAIKDGANNTIADTYIPKTIGSAKGDILYWSAANTPTRLAAGSNGQVLKINSSGIPAWASDSNTDTMVKLTSKTDNVEYPIVLGPSSITSGTAYEAFYNSNIKINPSTGTITATTFAGTATKATQDGAGNVIVDTYIPKGIGTAKGDIIYWSASGVPARLAIGSNGQVLKVNSSGLPVWSADSNSDTKVKLTATTTSSTGNYPVVMGPTSITSGSAYEANYNANIYITPGDSSITATLFHGKADQATADGAGNVITDYYIPKNIGTAKGDIIYWTGSGTPARLAAGSDGKVLKLVNGIPAWGSDIDVDIKVSLTSTSTSGDYPLMFGPTTINSGNAYEAFYNSGIKVNPNTKTITASYFDGTATKASQDGAGNVIVDTYAKRDGSNATGTWGISISGNAATATVASKISDLNANDNASSTSTWRKVWFSYNDNTTGRPALSDTLAYQSSTGTLRATTFKGNLDGNAATASRASADAAGNSFENYIKDVTATGRTITVTKWNQTSTDYEIDAATMTIRRWNASS